MPFESALDIYYETSTAGLVHELNEGIQSNVTPGDFNASNLIITDDDVFEDIVYFDETTGNPTNEFAAILEIKDNNDNEITVGASPGQIHNPVLVLPSKNYKIISCIGSKWIGDNQDLTNDFEIIYDADIKKFKIRPKNNLFYNRFAAPSFYAFSLEFSIVKEDGSIQLVTSTFNLTLNNKVPIITSSLSPSVVEIFEPDLSTTNNINKVIYTIEAENGGASNKTSGIKYYSMEPSNNFNIPQIVGREGFVSTRRIVVDTEDNIVPELFIDEQTGEISLNSNFQGYLNKTIKVIIYDNEGFDHDILGNIDLNAIAENSEGKLNLSTTINIKVSSSFIVISPQLEYYGTNGFFSILNSFYLEDIRTDSFELNGTEMFGNFSWSAGDPIADSAGTFLCAGQFQLTGESFPTIQGGSTTVSQAWGLTKGTNGEPIVKLYRKETGDAITTLISPSVSTGEGQYGTSYYNTSGVNGPTEVSTVTSEENNSNPQDWDSQPEPWFSDEYGNITGYAVAPNIPSFTEAELAAYTNNLGNEDGFSDNFFKGSFGVAEQGNANITKRISLPLNRQGNTDWVNETPLNFSTTFGDPTALQDGNWMFLAKENFTDGNGIDYNVLYEVEHLNFHTITIVDNIQYNFWNPRLKKVMLCKKP